MHQLERIRGRRGAGFSLYEVLITILCVAILLYIGIRFYDRPIEKSKESLIHFQANTFSRTVSTLRGQGVVQGGEKVSLENVIVFLNEFGWPANADQSFSPLSNNQTPEECQQLWNAVFQTPTSTSTSIERNKKVKFYISSINGRICRYELMRKQETPYFFDYHLNTGQVIVSP